MAESLVRYLVAELAPRAYVPARATPSVERSASSKWWTGWWVQQGSNLRLRCCQTKVDVSP
jgi:hypothetical protein